MTTPAPDLAAAVGRLYAAFAGVPKPRTIDGCPCCLENKTVRVLLGTPLRELTPDDLASYAASAFLTVGATADYLYFLPRILEITATEPGWWPSPEVTGRAVRGTDPAGWPARRWDALSGFLLAAVGEAVRLRDPWDVDSWLCAIGRMGLDVRPFLDRVAADPVAVRAVYELNADDLARGRLANEFWEPPDPAFDAVRDWLQSPAVEATGLTVPEADRPPPPPAG